MRRKRLSYTIPIFLVLAALGLVLPLGPKQLAAQMGLSGLLNKQGRLTNPNFGMCFINSAEDFADQARYNRALDTGTAWNRFPFYWGNIETSAGNYDFSRQDTAVTADVNNGLRTLAILMSTPDFYATGGVSMAGPLVQQKSLPDPSTGKVQANATFNAQAVTTPQRLYEPIFTRGDGLTDDPNGATGINPNNPWANFVYKSVQRYKPGGVLAQQRGWAAGVGVSYWEIWNEPNLGFFWGGSVADYYRLLKVAYLSAKSADPNCTVVMAGLANWPPPLDWLDQFLSTMASDPDSGLRDANRSYFDVLAMHCYSTSTEAITFLQGAQARLNSRGLSKPLWITETGVPACGDYPGPSCPSYYRASTTEQASYVVQTHAYSLYAGAQVVFHFQLHDDCGNGPTAQDAWGLYRNSSPAACYPSDANARLSQRTYQLIAEQLRGVSPLWRQTPNNDQEQIAFYRNTGHRVVVMWATQGHNTTANIAAVSNTAVLMDLDGTVSTIQPQNGYYVIPLEQATNQNQPSSPAYTIGGKPRILVELSAPILNRDLMVNGAFENSLSGWLNGGSTTPLITSDNCLSGKCLVLGSNFKADPTMNGIAGNSTLWQEIVLEPSMYKPTLRFHYKISSQEAEKGHDWFEAIIYSLGPSGPEYRAELITPKEIWQSCDWQDAAFDLSEWRGKRVQVVLNVYQDSAERPTVAWVDNVAVKDEGRHTTVLPMVYR